MYAEGLNHQIPNISIFPLFPLHTTYLFEEKQKSMKSWKRPITYCPEPRPKDMLELEFPDTPKEYTLKGQND